MKDDPAISLIDASWRICDNRKTNALTTKEVFHMFDVVALGELLIDFAPKSIDDAG